MYSPNSWGNHIWNSKTTATPMPIPENFHSVLRNILEPCQICRLVANDVLAQRFVTVCQRNYYSLCVIEIDRSFGVYVLFYISQNILMYFGLRKPVSFIMPMYTLIFSSLISLQVYTFINSTMNCTILSLWSNSKHWTEVKISWQWVKISSLRSPFPQVVNNETLLNHFFTVFAFPFYSLFFGPDLLFLSAKFVILLMVL